MQLHLEVSIRYYYTQNLFLQAYKLFLNFEGKLSLFQTFTPAYDLVLL
jgi:hypothetical protein